MSSLLSFAVVYFLLLTVIFGELRTEVCTNALLAVTDDNNARPMQLSIHVLRLI